MKRLRLPWFLRQTRAAAIVDFALVVPILFLMVSGIISSTRAYQRLNALTSSLREGARTASTLDSIVSLANRRTAIRTKILTFSSSFGYAVDNSLVTTSRSWVSFSPASGFSNESELLVVVTPVVVDPLNPRPRDHAQMPGDTTRPALDALRRRRPPPPR